MATVVAIGVGLAALAGAALAPIRGVHPAMGTEVITAAFVIVVIGGLGSFWGVVLAAIIVGVRARAHRPVLSAGRAGLDLPLDVPRPPGPAARLLGERFERLEA